MFGKVGRADTATDPAPFSMAETTVRLLPRARVAEARPDHAGIRLGARAAASGRSRLLWPEETPPTTAELVEMLDRAVALARLDQRLDRAGAGAHGHDGDRRSHAGRRSASWPRTRRGWMRSARRCARAVGRCPGPEARVFESLGGETRLTFVPDRAGRWRGTT